MSRTRVQKAGSNGPTRNDVAKAAQVSGATVSRVLSDRPDVYINEETRRRVMDAAAQLGYMLNSSASALRSGRTQLVGLWMCLGYSRYRGQVLDRIRRILGSTDMALSVNDVEEDLFWRRSLNRALRVPVDGIIAFDTPTAGAAFAHSQKARSAGTPFVSMGAFWSEETSFVGVDLGAGTEEAMSHLFATGRRRIALLTYSPNGDQLKEEPRRDVYRAQMEGHGFEPTYLSTSDISIESAQQSCREYLKSSPAPEAIFCMNDDLAIGACRAISDLGLRVGQDIAIVGCDGIEEGGYLSCPITTIRQPIDEMCGLAWQFLHELIEDPTAPLKQRVLKPTLVVRESSRTGSDLSV